MTQALAIFAVLAVAGAIAGWALCKHAGHLDAQADARDGKGNAPASGSPAWAIEPGSNWPAATPHSLSDERVRQVLGDAFDRHYAAAIDSLRHAGRCGAPGPGGMVCDLPPHEGLQHSDDGCTWWGTPVPKRPTTLDGFR